MQTKKRLWLTMLLCFSLVAWAGVASAQLSGAIYTGDEFGNTQVQFDTQFDAYLMGGPSGQCGSAGLPDGDYYFQITDPAGKELLTDGNTPGFPGFPTSYAAPDKFKVEGGIITEYKGTDRNVSANPGRCGSLVIQLFPFDETLNPGGNYKLWATPVDKYDPDAANATFGFLAAWSKTQNFKVKNYVPPGGEPPPPPPPVEDVTISGLKFYDANANGGLDEGELPIEGWLVKLYQKNEATADWDLVECAFTDADGAFAFTVPTNSGEYKIEEVFPGGMYPMGTYLPTTDTSYVVTALEAEIELPEFGNVCLGPGGGKTLGFWSNKNGQKLVDPDDLEALRALNLVGADGNAFNPDTYAAFRTWLLSANATNMAYMLSAQLAAMKLNVLNGFVDGDAVIYAPGINGTNFATVNEIMTKANDELGTHGTAYAEDAWRSYQEALKDALDNANNNKNFVQAEACPFEYGVEDADCPVTGATAAPAEGAESE